MLLAYGRLYLDSEMTVLSAAGVSQQRLTAYTLVSAAGVACLVAWLSLSLAPQGATEVAKILNQQAAMTEFDTLDAGRFSGHSQRHMVTYTEKLSEDLCLSGVFISDKRLSAAGDKERAIALLVAEGHQEIQADGSHYPGAGKRLPLRRQPRSGRLPQDSLRHLRRTAAQAGSQREHR